MREPPQWVIDFLASWGSLDHLEPLGSGFVQKRDGVVIDRWPDHSDLITGTSDVEPVGLLASTARDTGFWREITPGFGQFVEFK